LSKSDLDKLVTQLHKQYGDNSAYKLPDIPKYDIIPTGSLSLDYALGIGGLPSNRVGEIFGSEGTGKTTLCLFIANNFLKRYPDRAVVFLDLEHRLEADWASTFVDDPSRLIVLKPSDAEEGVNMYRDMAKSGQVSLQVWDSIGGSPTARGLEKDANTVVFAGNSGIITKFAQYAATLSGKFNFATLGINQERMDMAGFNRPTSPGGKGWKHACSYRIRLKRATKDVVKQDLNGEKDVPVGYQVHAHIIKSSIGAPGRVANYWFYNIQNKLGFGIDQIEEVGRLGGLTGVFEKSGTWYKHPSFPGGQLQGDKQIAAFLKDSPEVCEKLSSEIMTAMKSGNIDMSEIVPIVSPDDEDEPMSAIDQIRAQIRQ
jgi:recombination protein RecA